MRGGDILDPAQVNRVVHMILLINVAGPDRNDHFENRVGSHKSDISFQTKPFHQFLTDLHLQVRLQTAEKFLAPLRIHGGEIAHEFVARLIFSVLAPTDADGNNGGDDPDGNIRSRNHG